MANKVNRHCPVSGCKTVGPHSDDPIVKGLIRAFAPPEQMALWTLAAMAELAQSIRRDLTEKRSFSWLSRLRQPEELYVRTLYALFIATDKELHHILSGEMPNGLSRYYSEVNRVILGGRGLMQASLPGLKPGTFKPIDRLNDGAHVNFRTLLTCIGWAKNPEQLPSPDKYLEHLQRYCAYLDYMHGMFKSGKKKRDVLDGVINLHRSASDWAGDPKPRRSEIENQNN